MLRSSDKVVQQRTAFALARLASDKDEMHEIFITKGGLDVLLEMVLDQHSGHIQQVRLGTAFLLLSHLSVYLAAVWPDLDLLCVWTG